MATAYERVRIARGAKRPTGMDYIQNVFHGFFELHGDRRYADDPAIVGGLAYLGATPVTVIAIEKGHTAKERVQRGFGAPQPEGYRKALRLMREAEKFHRPVVCFVDTSGAGCNVGAEERGQGEAIAECLTTMSALQTPVLSILIGEGGSGGALALAAGDRVWMLENAVYSVISPEGCATILWKDAAKAEQAAEELKLTADDALPVGERSTLEIATGAKVVLADGVQASIPYLTCGGIPFAPGVYCGEGGASGRRLDRFFAPGGGTLTVTRGVGGLTLIFR